MNLPGEFVVVREHVAVRRGYEAELDGWLRAAYAPPPGRAARDVEARPASGRGTVAAVDLPGGGRAFVRRYVHGGLLRHLLRDVYWGRPPRPWRELVATEAARRAGIVAPEVLAAAALPLAGAGARLYRGVLVTRGLPGRRPLTLALRAASGAAERLEWIACATRAISDLHAAGIRHPDLNVGNVLVAAAPTVPAALIDFDRARVGTRPVGRVGRVLARRRLSRSIAKLGLAGLDRAGAARAIDAAGAEPGTGSAGVGG